jgi:hypothetical protein
VGALQAPPEKNEAMKTSLRHIDDHGVKYDALMFACPGCAATREGYDGIHMLPVNAPAELKKPSWTWDGNREAPTLHPSILTKFNWDGVEHSCHSYLKNGIFEFLGDSTHAFAGQQVSLPELPVWTED